MNNCSSNFSNLEQKIINLDTRLWHIERMLKILLGEKDDWDKPKQETISKPNIKEKKSKSSDDFSNFIW